MLAVWGPRYSKLRSASNKERIKIWNEIFIAYKESCPDSERTLPQVKKRQQNLEYEYKLLKQRSQSTGEAGFKKIKEGFPYFDFFDDVMGHRDSTFAFEEGSSTSLSPQGSVADTENMENEFETATPNEGVKRKATDKPAKSGSKGKKRRDEQTATSEWQTSFLQLMERSIEQDNIRFERSTEMLRESQKNQLEQTNAILAGFKDIFKDLVSK